MKHIKFVLRFIKHLIINTYIDVRSKDDDNITVTKVVSEGTIVYTITVKHKPKS